MDEPKNRCFIITPIGNESDPIRRHIDGIIEAAIIPSLSEKYEIVVSHKISEPGSITKQIISEIYNDKLVIVNLTNRNPNVMYELAFRHALGTPVIMIAEDGTLLPSDIISQRTIFYRNDAKGVLELTEAIKKAEAEINYEDKCSPILDIVKEIDQDEKILTNIKTKDHGDNAIEPFTYILNRLNRIEDSLSVANNIRTRLRRQDEDLKYPHLTSIAFTFEKINRNVNEGNLLNRLKQFSVIDSDAFIQDVQLDCEKQLILIIMKIDGPIAGPELYQYCYRVLSQFGFSGVKPMDAEKCIHHSNFA